MQEISCISFISICNTMQCIGYIFAYIVMEQYIYKTKRNRLYFIHAIFNVHIRVLFLCSLLGLLCCGHHMPKYIIGFCFSCLCYLCEMRSIKGSSFKFVLPYLCFFFPALKQWNVNLFRAFGPEQKVIVESPTVFAISCLPAGSLLRFWRLALRAHETEHCPWNAFVFQVSVTGKSVLTELL